MSNNIASQDASSEQPEIRGFEAEVGRLLHIVANALYSEREVFLRELTSNAADACDRLRYEALSDPALLVDAGALAIDLVIDSAQRTLTISDNGIGMSRDELISHLGTIARSGTSAFLNKLSGDARKDTSLIGQFGVGFYSAFMVADRVTVDSRRAGQEESWLWSSDGGGSFSIARGTRAHRGTTIVLHLKEDAAEFLEPERVRTIIRTYSNHISFPVRLRSEDREQEPEQINEGGALWRKPKAEVTEEQYHAFYRQTTHGFDQPWLTLHFHAEGVIDYTGLLFIPSHRPFDLFHPERRSQLKLYVKRVFITDSCQDLVPSYLRFLRGVIDSADLPLNISREMLQNNPVISKIRGALVKRTLEALEKRAEQDPDSYGRFWDAFGAVLKEGLYESAAERERLLKLARFHSTAGDALVSLETYVSRMKEGQDSIWFINGENREALAKSPQLEGFIAKGVEVLYMTDPVDDFWTSTVQEYSGKAFKSVTRAGADLSAIKAADDASVEAADRDRPEATAMATLISVLKVALGDVVRDVRESTRLTASPVCLVADESGADIHLERLLKQHGQLNAMRPRILEINSGHALIRALAARAEAGADLSDDAALLLDQARIVGGESPADPTAFAQRLTLVMERALH